MFVMDQDGMSNLYREPSIDASYQVSDHLAKRFQRKRFLEIDQSETRLPETCWEVVSHSDWQTWKSCQTEKYFVGPKKSPQKFTVTCIMFSLAFLEWFTLVLAIGHLISPLVFIEVKVIKFSVFSVVQNCICYVFYSVCLEFCCFDDLVL
jgi:hypothetical protein